MAYKLDMRDIHFNLFEMLSVESLSEFEAFQDFSADDYRMILSEAEKLAVNIIAPILPVTDKEGARSVDREIVVPEAVREAFRFFVTNILPEVYGIARAVESDDTSPMEVEF